MNTIKDRNAGVTSDGFVSVPDAARFLQLSRSKVYALMESGELTYAKFGRCRRIPRRALTEFAEKSLVGA
jgi:excisionase family DNA binding protein